VNERGKKVDTTFLSLDNAEERGFIHRDYIAHCLRWSHVIKWLAKNKRYATARVLDVGCGRELPLAKTLYSSRFIVEAYHGVDYGPILDSALDAFHSGKFPIDVYEKTDFLSVTLEDIGDKLANVITCFEVLEHVEPLHMRKMLQHMKTLSTGDATFFLSTPCYNHVDCAANHVNEMTYEALGAVFEQEGFVVEASYGTFASIRDYEGLLTPAQRELFVSLREYYDVNFLSCVFAPLFPALSRNALWVLRKVNNEEVYCQFGSIDSCKTPWGSSEKWQEMKATE
jgi:hypothetical protein